MLSVLLALLAHTADPALTLTPMTPAVGGSVCLLKTPFDGVTPREEASACENGEQCFEHAAFAVHKSDAVPHRLSFASLAGHAPEHLAYGAFMDAEKFSHVRPPGRSLLFSMSSVQRE